MNTRYATYGLVVLILAAGGYFTWNYFMGDDGGDLPGVEITEYEGENLGSIDAFRENSIKGSQTVDVGNYTLSVTGLVENPRNYTYDEVLSTYEDHRKVVTINCVEGWSVKILWDGVLVSDLLEDVGISSDAQVVIFRAVDGYSTSVPVDYLIENDIMIAYGMNGVTLPPERGFPFQLVAESKWGYKWIKWITSMEVSDDVEFEGFWERRGYSNVGDLDKEFFD